VIEDSNSDGPACLDHLAGHRPVFGGGGRISGWVVVNQHDGGRFSDNGRAKYLARVNQRRVEDPPRHRHVVQDPVLAIQEEGMELLVGKIPEAWRHEGEYIGGPTDPGARRQPFVPGAAPEFQGGEMAGRSG
jgi:hypothetical protein